MTDVGGVEVRDIARKNGSSSPASSVPGAGAADYHRLTQISVHMPPSAAVHLQAASSAFQPPHKLFSHVFGTPRKVVHIATAAYAESGSTFT